MFFSQDILQKRGGKFGVIWIAATKPIQLTRRDYSSVNVAKSCDDIINYITLRGPPIKPGGARPRFSLYLSSQLMYGVVRVYNKQQHYLMSDTTTLCGRFRSVASTCEIDLKGLMRLDAVSMPDISKDSAPRGAQFNPEFGVFRFEDFVAPAEIPDISSAALCKLIPTKSPCWMSLCRQLLQLRRFSFLARKTYLPWKKSSAWRQNRRWSKLRR